MFRSPKRLDDFYYYSRTETGKQYAIYCRKKGSLDAKEEVLLDENELAKGQKYFRVGSLSVSRDHKLLAYSTDTNGSETYVLRINLSRQARCCRMKLKTAATL